MTFIEFNFYIFLAILVVAYYLIPLKYRWYSLLVGSLAFYWYVSQYSRRRFCMLLGAAFVCWLLSNFIKKDTKLKWFWLTISIFMMAFPLVLIKELPFISGIVTHKSMPEWWLVPVGIAFYSMQLIAYVVDVYKGGGRAGKKSFQIPFICELFSTDNPRPYTKIYTISSSVNGRSSL